MAAVASLLQILRRPQPPQLPKLLWMSAAGVLLDRWKLRGRMRMQVQDCRHPALLGRVYGGEAHGAAAGHLLGVQSEPHRPGPMHPNLGLKGCRSLTHGVAV